MRIETLDLHGLSSEEAWGKTEKQITWVISHQVPVLVLIHGKGHHNPNRVAVIKQLLRKQLKTHELITSNGYMVIYGESNVPIASAYDEGSTLIVLREYMHTSTGGKKQAEEDAKQRKGWKNSAPRKKYR